ncbi:hypothetical protein SAMN04487768_1252 [Burkholderia sp. b13]|nr:hypothetical protein SAMN04487768_1252 [Burkholderia sp. b13]
MLPYRPDPQNFDIQHGLDKKRIVALGKATTLRADQIRIAIKSYGSRNKYSELCSATIRIQVTLGQRPCHTLNCRESGYIPARKICCISYTI